VMRDGCYIATKLTKDTTRKELINLMVGRQLSEVYPNRTIVPRETAFEVRKVSGNGDKDISFSVKKGEILGLAGLVGSGRTELAMLLCGAVPVEKGEIWVNGKPLRVKSPADTIKAGIGMLPEDRKRHGLFLDQDIKWNISFPILKKLNRYGIVSRKKEKKLGQKYKDQLDIKAPTIEQKLINLSGGNQQKVVLAKSLAAESDILIFDEPTRGIDVGAKQEIYRLMTMLANKGVAIVMISSEMEELLGMSDRIIVLCEGEIMGEVKKKQFSQDLILDLASGTH
jgi:ribose transport system ATP-binding protein